MPVDSSDDTSVTAPARTGITAGVLPLLLVGGLLAMVLAVGLVSLTGGVTGPVDAYGLTVVRVATQIGAVLTIGSLLFATFMATPQPSGVLGVGGYAAVRTAFWSAVLWCVASLLMIPFLSAEALGKSVFDLDTRTVLDMISLLEQAKVSLITAVITLVVVIGTARVLTWSWTAVLFGIALVGIMPVGFTGHSSTGGNHDLATDSLLLHLIAASLWVGGLVALLIFGRRSGDATALRVATTRFSAVALVCWIVMAVSGLINAWVRLPVSDLFDTSYGLLTTAKIAALVLLGGFGYLQRQRGVRAVVERGSSSALIRLASVEVLVMLLTIGLAAALARTPPSSPTGQLTSAETQLGYQLEQAPTLGTLLLSWRFNLIFGTAAIALAVCYIVGVRRLRRRGDTWPVGRTVAWLSGCAVVLVATSSGFGRYAPAVFSVHMETHMMLSMLAPILLVLGAPVTLGLRAMRPAGRDQPPGPREWLLALVRSPLSHWLTHPVIALTLFVGSFYLLYFSGLFDAALEQHWAHLAMNAHFLLAGYVFYWPVIGVDPAPRQLPHIARLGLVFASLPFHAFFGVILMGMQTVIGEVFYQRLGLSWNADLLTDQRLGGGIAWAAGEIPLLLVLVALLTQWARADDREARRRDRRADADGEADLEAYNEMLRRLSDGDKR